MGAFALWVRVSYSGMQGFRLWCSLSANPASFLHFPFFLRILGLRRRPAFLIAAGNYVEARMWGRSGNWKTHQT